MKALDRNKGSLTMEAAVVVPIFTFAILTIVFFMKLVYVQEIMQKGITDAADGIAQYAYIYDASGFMDIANRVDDSLDEGAKLAEEHIEKTTEALDEISQVEKGSKSIIQGDFSNMDNVDELLNQGEDAIDKIGDVAGDVTDENGIKREAITFISLAGKLLLKEGNKQITKLITTMILADSLKTDTMSANDRLKSLHVVQSLGQLDFSGSEIFMNGDHNEVDIIVTYDVKIPMPFNFIPKFTVTQRASTLAWLGATRLGEGSGSGESN